MKEARCENNGERSSTDEITRWEAKPPRSRAIDEITAPLAGPYNAAHKTRSAACGVNHTVIERCRSRCVEHALTQTEQPGNRSRRPKACDCPIHDHESRISRDALRDTFFFFFCPTAQERTQYSVRRTECVIIFFFFCHDLDLFGVFTTCGGAQLPR